MDFQSAMETFAEAWVAANTKSSLSDLNTQSEALALTRGCSPPPVQVQSPPPANGGGESPSGDRHRMRCSPPHTAAAVARSAPPPTSVATVTHAPNVAPPATHHLHHHAGPLTSATVDTKVNANTPPSTPRTHKDDTFDLTKSSCGKSLPVHCVVETIYSMDDASQHNAWRRRPVVETDSYVIIPVNTVFHELVQVALHRLGYSPDSAAAAKGSVVIKNWKPLSFDKIADGPLVTVGDILGELTTVATLRIQVFRARPSILADVKEKLLKLFLVQSHSMLLSTGCPLDELTLTQICRGQNSHYMPELSEDARRKFEQWWSSQVSPSRVHHPTRPQSAAQYSPSLGVVGSAAPNSSLSKLDRSPALAGLTEHVHPALQTVQSQYPTQKTRMRTSFDPELELPKLQSWFADNQHPSRQQIQQYVKELNGLESRRGRKPLDVNNVVYWFKNARAAQKRAETRGLPPGTIPCHLGVNGYGNSIHSPPNGTGLLLAADNYLHPDRLLDHSVKSSPSIHGNEALMRSHHMGVISEEMSNQGSDLADDEDDQQHSDDEDPSSRPPLSPTGPLSLTMSKNRDRDNDQLSSPRHSPPQEVVQHEIKDEIQRSPPSSSDNNNHKQEIADISDTEPDVEEVDHQSIGDVKRAQMDDDSLYKMDLSRPSLNRFRSPTPDMEASGLISRTGPAGLDRLAAGFPLVPNSMFSHSIMYMSHYIPGLTHSSHNLSAPPSGGSTLSALAASSADERRKRNRTFIDPVTEVPRLEQWFSLSTHPSHNLILKYTDELNRMPYRQKFPRLEPKNVQFWFKNRRAKCKRLKMALYDNPPNTMHPQYHCKQE